MTLWFALKSKSKAREFRVHTRGSWDVEVDNASGKKFKLPSKLHEIFFHKGVVLNRIPHVPCDALVEFVKQMVERMNLNYLSRTKSDDRLYERHYQAGFYRAALTVLPENSKHNVFVYLDKGNALTL
jgi:hypothetical protein